MTVAKTTVTTTNVPIHISLIPDSLSGLPNSATLLYAQTRKSF